LPGEPCPKTEREASAQSRRIENLDEIVKGAGLSDNFKGKMQVSLLGKDYEIIATTRDSFGEWAFELTLRERTK
jgi:hypothetical protein